ncbi:hypothetical protein KAS45_05780 [candidate division WOR-3 bacterium]|nr:hypothetical protein [candidate division WOR-3 bacterium]
MLFFLVLLSYPFTAYLDSSLAFVGLTRDDISLRCDYSVRDPYRFAIVDSLLKHPLESVDYLLTLHQRFWKEPPGESLVELIGLYGFEADTQGSNLLECLHGCNEMISGSFTDIQDELGNVFEELIVFEPEPTGSIEEEKAYEKEHDSLVTFLGENGFMINYGDLFRAALMILKALDDFSVSEVELSSDTERVDGVQGDVLYYEEFDFGRVVIGGRGTNIYGGDFAVIIDLGGDDTYRDTGVRSNIRLIVDESGDDSYWGGDYTLACGRFGVSVLIDKEGDDTYQARNFSIGVGVFGVGILIDRAGDDRYYGDTFTQGAGGFGIGILRDESGNDLYEGSLHAQGFASTYGVGILGDGCGNDLYLIREKYLDEIRYLDHYLSMSQGFSIGFRPDLSAGIGLLFDRSGNDYYVGDIFAQGAGYWYGIGAIVESGGNDNYVAYQYAQASGVHVALGLLIDENGNDNYVAKGVSQGCGHDLSLGLLYDCQGDDTYAAFDLSQGAGNANGIGMLIDDLGDDTYAVKRLQNTQGYGNFRREYGSIGVLIDLLGDDSYTSGNDTMFWQKGEHGIGIDWK